MDDIEREGTPKKATKPDQVSLDVLVRGAEKTFDNAEHLFREAELLAEVGAVARALCLHRSMHGTRIAAQIEHRTNDDQRAPDARDVVTTPDHSAQRPEDGGRGRLTSADQTGTRR
jgi:hypothetical protein